MWCLKACQKYPALRGRDVEDMQTMMTLIWRFRDANWRHPARFAVYLKSRGATQCASEIEQWDFDDEENTQIG